MAKIVLIICIALFILISYVRYSTTNNKTEMLKEDLIFWLIMLICFALAMAYTSILI
jgi:MFS-type transporter involved in bile tolerance (Atg22 family)